MSKYIIDNQSELIDDKRAFELVATVIGRGKVSNYGKQHCYVTSFPWDAKGETRIIVSSSLNDKSERFVVYDH